MKRRHFNHILGGTAIATHPAISTLSRLFNIDEYKMKALRGNVTNLLEVVEEVHLEVGVLSNVLEMGGVVSNHA